MNPKSAFLLFPFLIWGKTEALEIFSNLTRVVNFGSNVYIDFHVDSTTGNIYTVNKLTDQFKLDLIDPQGKKKSVTLEASQNTLLREVKICPSPNFDNELVVIVSTSLTEIFVLDSRNLTVKNTTSLSQPIFIQSCKQMQYISWSAAGDSLVRFDSSWQILWETELTGGFIPPAAPSPGLASVIYQDSIGLLQTIGFSTGVGPQLAQFGSNCNMDYPTLKVTQSPGTLLCQQKWVTTGFYLTFQGNSGQIESSTLVDVITVADTFTVLSTKNTIMAQSWLTIMYRNLTVIRTYAFPSKWEPSQLLASDSAVYLVVSCPTRVKFLNSWIAPGLNMLQFDLVPLLKSNGSALGSTTRYTSDPTQTPGAVIPATDQQSILVPVAIPTIIGSICLISGILLIMNKRKKATDHEQGKNPTFTSEVTATTVTTMNTLFTSTIPLSIPGYLELRVIDFRTVQLIETGGGGFVFKGQVLNEQWVSANRTNQCVIKCPAEQDTKIPSKRNHFYREVALHHHLNNTSEFFATLIGYESSTLSILMKYYPMGSMRSLFKNPEFAWTKSIVHSCVSDVAHGLQCMHRLGFSHCDIKPDNILMEYQEAKKRVVALITDLGISLVVNDTSMGVEQFRPSTIFGFSLHYAAPELLLIHYSQSKDARSPDVILAGDIYAYSLVLYQTLHHTNSPWQDTKTTLFSNTNPLK